MTMLRMTSALVWLALLGAAGCGDDDGVAADAGGGGGMDAGGGSSDGGGPGTDGGGPGTDGSAPVDSGSGGTDGGNTGCAMTGESCLTSACCGALNCCSGMPVPAGMSVCYDTCPRSDRNLKEGFEDVDGEEILEGVAQLPISRWSYVADPPGVRHVGPMAQDFQQTFDVGASDRLIFQIDADGVALASIQALERRTSALRADNARLRRDNDSLRARLDAIESRLSGRARR